MRLLARLAWSIHAENVRHVLVHLITVVDHWVSNNNVCDKYFINTLSWHVYIPAPARMMDEAAASRDILGATAALRGMRLIPEEMAELVVPWRSASCRGAVGAKACAAARKATHRKATRVACIVRKMRLDRQV